MILFRFITTFTIVTFGGNLCFGEVSTRETYLDKKFSQTLPRYEVQLNKCIENSVKSLQTTTDGFDEIISAFKEDGEECFKSFSWSNSKDIIGPTICGCKTNDKFLKFKENSLVNSNIDELINKIIRLETIKAFRASYFANFETCKHLLKLHKQGKISSSEFASVGACSADAFTGSVFEELNGRDEKSCPGSIKKEGLEVLLGTSDQDEAKNFLTSIGNSIALNTISPEDKEKGYCLPKDVVSEFADPAIETAHILGPDSMINPFDAMVSEIPFSSINEMMLETQMFTSSQPEILNNLFNQNGTPFTERELRGARSIGDNFSGFLNKNPLARIAMADPVMFNLLGKLPPKSWKGIIENEKNLEEVGNEANRFCSSVTQKTKDEFGKLDSSKSLKTLGDIICGTHKPKIDPRTYVSQIAPRVHKALGADLGRIASLSYAKRSYCVDTGSDGKLKFDKEKSTGGDFENDIAKVGLSTKSDIEKKYIKDESHPTPSEYDSLNKGLCSSNIFGGCDEDPKLDKCSDLDTIIGNINSQLATRLKELDIDLNMVKAFGEAGVQEGYENIDELIKDLSEHPEKYGMLTETGISDEEYYEVKSLLTALYAMKNKKSTGEEKMAYFETVGKSSSTGIDPIDIMANADRAQAANINNTFTDNRDRPVGTPPEDIPFERQLDTERVRSIVSKPTPEVNFSNEASEVRSTPTGNDGSGNDNTRRIGPTVAGGDDRGITNAKEPASESSGENRSRKVATSKGSNRKDSSVKTDLEPGFVENKQLASQIDRERAPKDKVATKKADTDLKERLVREMEANNALRDRLADVEALKRGARGSVRDELTRQNEELRNRKKQLSKEIEEIGSTVRRNDYSNKLNNGRPFSNETGDPYSNIYGEPDVDDSSLVAGDDEKKEDDELSGEGKEKAFKGGKTTSGGKKATSGKSSEVASSEKGFIKRFGKDGIAGGKYSKFGKESFEFELIYDGEYVSKVGIDNFIKLKHLEGMTFRTIEQGQLEDSWTLRLYDFVLRDSKGEEVSFTQGKNSRLRYKQSYDQLRPIETLLDQNASLTEVMQAFMSENSLNGKDVLLYMDDARTQTEQVASMSIDEKQYEAHEKFIVSLSLNEKLLADYENMKSKNKKSRVSSAK